MKEIERGVEWKRERPTVYLHQNRILDIWFGLYFISRQTHTHTRTHTYTQTKIETDVILTGKNKWTNKDGWHNSNNKPIVDTFGWEYEKLKGTKTYLKEIMKMCSNE